MKKELLLITCLVSFSSYANNQIPSVCFNNVNAQLCQHYLEGVVDGALMFKPLALGERVELDDYKSRALKYRGGKRYQEANRVYCGERIPNRDVLLQGISEEILNQQITSIDSLTAAMKSLLDCQRLN